MILPEAAKNSSTCAVCALSPIIACTSVDYERLVVDNLPLVDSVVRTIARRHRLSADEADELGSSVKLKLVENDYEVFRKFEGRSQLRTYLITVVQRHFLDQRNARWGKWRPSAQARRLGPPAVLLDQLLTRDRLSFDDAVQAVLARHGDAVSIATLREIALQLPARSSRVFLGEHELEHLPAPADGDAIESSERRLTGARVERALAAALQMLSDDERAILQLRFCGNVKLARIAELLGEPAKPFYRRVEELLRVLRGALQTQGVSEADVLAILEDPDTGFGELLERAAAGKTGERPSVP
jgi:RNA polymerase sigma factor (sigma-70 family)